MGSLHFDPSLSIEGTATALGVVGAALGYLINLVAGWIRKWKDDRYRGTKLAILEMLERHLPNGLTEAELFALYNSEATGDLRKKYKAWSPRSLDETDFERELKQLQLDFFIDLVGKDTYRLRHHPVSRYEQEEREIASRAALLRGRVDKAKLRETARRAFRDASDRYARRDAAELLIELEDQEGITQVLEALDSGDHQAQLRRRGCSTVS